MQRLNRTIPQSRERLPVLSGLRGIAIILVAWFHFWQQSWFSPRLSLGGFTLDLTFIPATGFLGVEIFILVGAFGLFYPYVKAHFNGAATRSLKQYTYRRLIRILPSYYLMLILVCILGQGTSLMRNKNWWDILRHFLFINNLFPDTLLDSVNPVSWFVGMQIQFYLIFPLLCRAFRKRPVLSYFVLQTFAIAYRLFVYNSQHHQLSYLFNQLPGYIDIYAMGMLAAYLFVWLKKRLRNPDRMKLFFTLAAFFSLLIFGTLMKYIHINRYYGQLQDYQLMTRQYCGWALMLLLLCSLFAYAAWQKALSNAFFRFMAGISYNFFLWHQWLAVQIRIRKFIPFKNDDPYKDPLWQIIYFLIICAASLGMALLITYAFERPLQKKGLRKYFLDIGRVFMRPKVLPVKNNVTSGQSRNRLDDTISGEEK